MTPRNLYLTQAFVWTCAIMTIAMLIAYYSVVESTVLNWWYLP